MNSLSNFYNNSHITNKIYCVTIALTLAQFLALTTGAFESGSAACDPFANCPKGISETGYVVLFALMSLVCAIGISYVETAFTMAFASVLSFAALYILGYSAFLKRSFISADNYLEPMALILMDIFVATLLVFAITKAWVDPPLESADSSYH